MRLATWARLERSPTGDLVGHVADYDTAKQAAISQAKRDGQVDAAIPPGDLLALITALSTTWSPASPMYTTTASDPPADHQRRRHALATAVQRLITTSREDV